ncbi:nuclear transport factor 2 family protein [Sphingomonas sp. So64.6b]|uniref:nuclear transport factor 2 family protein n=1 Tax=Sphingomonas sp. So64.6b TaxID=2997354 RepID=UPI001600DB4A|nr:nuclear transport factor 2 family protein [Sphingomonas sp. So64.6b]QNA83360.1 nuclear transport factor 2 family protein [Sphingomonas sp. So64.6b]
MTEQDRHETIVRAQYEAFRDRRRTDSEALLATDFTFTSPYDDAIDRDAFFERCWPGGDHFADFTIERVTVDADGAFVTYFVTTDNGAQFRNTEYLTVRDQQIRSVEVYFGASYKDGKFVAKEPS